MIEWDEKMLTLMKPYRDEEDLMTWARAMKAGRMNGAKAEIAWLIDQATLPSERRRLWDIRDSNQRGETDG